MTAANRALGPIVLAAGGTGGHVFPAQATAAALDRLGAPIAFLTDGRGAAFEVAGSTVALHRIRAASPSRGGLRGKLTAGFDLAVGTVQARAILRRIGASAVVGFGGYASVPTVLAARLLGLPVVLHEQNALIGRANRWLAGRATLIATSFPLTRGLGPAATARFRLCGNPVRPAVAAVAATPYPALTADGPVRLLVVGGSQGAAVFSTLVPAAVALLPEVLRRRIAVTQQVREDDIAAVSAAYGAAGVTADLRRFIDDVPAQLAACHLVIARAGASTIAELGAVGRPALLLPYPHAADDHQTINARALEDAGAAWCLPQGETDAAALAARLETLLTDPPALAAAAGAALGFGRVEAADRLAALVIEAAGTAHRQGGETDTAPATPAAHRHERRAAA